jgi:HNH endonuclease
MPRKKGIECDVSLLRQLLEYDPETGKLTWKIRQATSSAIVAWNAAHAGKPAFTAQDRHGYLVGAVLNRLYRAHRVCFAIFHGRWPDDVDHENGKRDQNGIKNLRESGSSGNGRNRGKDRRNTSGHAGVYQTKTGSWVAKIGRRGTPDFRQKTVPAKDEAINLRVQWEKDLGYSERHGRG